MSSIENQGSAPPGIISDAVYQLLLMGGLAPARFVSLVSTFGPLQEDGMRKLAERMVFLAGVYGLQIVKQLPTTSQQSDQLTNIGTSARRLLKAMGIDDSRKAGVDPVRSQALLDPTPHLWLLPELYRVAKERRPTTATFTACQRITFLLVLLSDLVAAADRCAISAQAQSVRASRRGRGGTSREGPTPLASLQYALFEMYADLRRQYPECASPRPLRRRRTRHNNGPMVVLDAPFKSFVHAGLALVAPDLAKSTTGDAIRGNFNRWSVHNPKRKAD
jgi:hypothetical protein